MRSHDPLLEPMLTKAHAQALARQSFSFFARGALQALLPGTNIVWAPYLDLIASRLEDVIEGRCLRLIINIPPRYGKSLMVSVALPAFLLARRPDAEITGVSYAQDLSKKMGGDTLRLMSSPYYTELFGNVLASRRERKADITTYKGGNRFATSIGGTFTGRGGNLIIIDDPLLPQDAPSEIKRNDVNTWYDNTVVSRPNNKHSDAIVVIMQRLHENDLVGHLIEKGEWEVLSLPVIAEHDEVYSYRNALGEAVTWCRKEGELLHPQRESLAVVAKTQADMSPYDFAAQYQQRPAPAGGGDILEKWFLRYDPRQPQEFIRKIQTWDTASKEGTRNDYSVCVTIGKTANNHYYILDIFRARLKFGDLKAKVRELANLHGVSTVLIEDSASGIALNQELLQEGFTRIIPVKANGSKYERILARTGLMQASRVWLPEQAHWVPEFLQEAVMFPNGRHDDQLDALAHGLKYLAASNSPHDFLAMMDRMMGKEPDPSLFSS